jgi:hypothetical protein
MEKKGDIVIEYYIGDGGKKTERRWVRGEILGTGKQATCYKFTEFGT